MRVGQPSDADACTYESQYDLRGSRQSPVPLGLDFPCVGRDRCVQRGLSVTSQGVEQPTGTPIRNQIDLTEGRPAGIPGVAEDPAIPALRWAVRLRARNPMCVQAIRRGPLSPSLDSLNQNFTPYSFPSRLGSVGMSVL